MGASSPCNGPRRPQLKIVDSPHILAAYRRGTPSMPWLQEEDALGASIIGYWEASGETTRFFPIRPGGTVLSGALPNPASITPQQAAAVHGGLTGFLSVRGPAQVAFAVLVENALKRDSH